jgi:hypothetical protein
MNYRQSGHAVLIVSVVIIVVVLIGLLGWMFWQNLSKANGSSVTNYDQCVAVPSSKILETYPEQCVTSDGRSFTGPIETNTVTEKTYCTEAEKLCFEYRDDWTIETFAIEGAEPGSLTDLIEVTSPDATIKLTLESGIGGLGGSCPDENKVAVTVLDATPAASMTGFEDEYSIDTLQVARVYYPIDGKYVTSLYITDSAEYATPGTLSACGIGFSQFINGRNAVLSPDFEGSGAFRFGLFGSSAGPTYDTEAQVKAAFESDTYTQAASLLASLHYE